MGPSIDCVCRKRGHAWIGWRTARDSCGRAGVA